MSSRLIFHVDVNSAFLSWESVRRVENGEPDLRLVPAIVGGDPDKRTSVVLTKSIPAKRYGIVTGEPVSAALRKCPGLVIAAPDFRLYSEKSRAFKAICREIAPVVEEFSIDECFLDMTGTRLLYPDPLKTAHDLKDRIRDELGFTVNVGVSENKLLAKMASDFEKPDKVHTLFPREVPEKMWPLPVRDLLFLGRSTASRLSALGIETIGALARTDPAFLKKVFGEKSGTHLYQSANGIDESPVSAESGEMKSYSMETTFESDLTDAGEAESVLLQLADGVSYRVRRDGIRAGCVTVVIRGNDMKRRSHQRNLNLPTDATIEIYEIAAALFREMWDGRLPIRLIGLSLSRLERESYAQGTLILDEKREKASKMDKTADGLRDRFGFGIITRGGLTSLRAERRKGLSAGDPSVDKEKGGLNDEI